MTETDARREDRIAEKMTRCVHFTGVQHRTCEAGVNYDDVRGEGGLGIPCFNDDRQNGATCWKVKWTTREEAEAEIASADAAFARVNTCFKAIRAKHGKARGLVDEMPCPTGCGGTLRYSIAGYNGHVHGRCSTEGCAAWMQ